MDGKATGTGVEIDPNGGRYEGQFLNNKRWVPVPVLVPLSVHVLVQPGLCLIRQARQRQVHRS